MSDATDKGYESAPPTQVGFEIRNGAYVPVFEGDSRPLQDDRSSWEVASTEDRETWRLAQAIHEGREPMPSLMPGSLYRAVQTLKNPPEHFNHASMSFRPIDQ